MKGSGGREGRGWQNNTNESYRLGRGIRFKRSLLPSLKTIHRGFQPIILVTAVSILASVTHADIYTCLYQRKKIMEEKVHNPTSTEGEGRTAMVGLTR